MILYIVIYIICALGCFNASLANSKSYRNFIIILLAIFFCFGYMTGSDWRSYETYYGWMKSDNDSFLLPLEPGYIIYSFLFARLGIDFWYFFIATKVVLFIAVICNLKKYANNNFILNLVFFFFFFGLFLFIDNPMRNFIAVALTTISYKYIIDRKFLPFCLLVLLASMFHLSAIMFLFFYFLYPIKIGNTKIVIYYILFNILFVLLYQKIIITVFDLFSFIPIVQAKLELYFIGGEELVDNQIFSLGFIIQIILFILILWKRKAIEELPYGKLIFWGSISYLFLYRIGLLVDIFYRLQLYFCILYTIGVCAIYKVLYIRNNKIFFISFVLSYLLLVTYITITGSYKYVPYTNYLQFIFDNDLSFDERAEYNFLNSPYYSGN